MDIEGFEIKNFKGIEHASLKFSGSDNARVYTLVGLNESGKTTLLEALESFAPDVESMLVVQGSSKRNVDFQKYIPRQALSHFSGTISIKAFCVSTDTNEWEDIISEVVDDYEEGVEITRGNKNLDKFEFRIEHHYKNGTYVGTKEIFSEESNFTWRSLVAEGDEGEEDERDGDAGEATFSEWEPLDETCLATLRSVVKKKLPTIAYYPTFVFDFPERIYLTQPNRSATNLFYYRVFDDVLRSLKDGMSVQNSFMSRFDGSEFAGSYAEFMTTYNQSPQKALVESAKNQAGAEISNVVFNLWTKIFQEDATGKNVELDILFDEAENEPEDGFSHEIYLTLKIKQSQNSASYKLNERSLGFRWFFLFLLFTQFRIQRSSGTPVIFLFDEPASNLHSAAQQKLLDSFPGIAQKPNRIVYSTHSHYMVNPQWLEQTYVVYDESTKGVTGVIQDADKDSASIDIHAVKYREFVNRSPSDVSYFQPIIDALEVVPSKFDYKNAGIIVEGRSDYYLISYAKKHLGYKDFPPIFPGMGTGTLHALVALHRGWGLPVHILFDNDQGKKDGYKNLKKETIVYPSEAISIDDFVPEGEKIESIFSQSDYAKFGGIGRGAKGKLWKTVQEALAASETLDIDDTTVENMRALIDGLKQLYDVHSDDQPTEVSERVQPK